MERSVLDDVGATARFPKNITHTVDEWRVVREMMRRLEEPTYTGLVRRSLRLLAEQNAIAWPGPPRG